MNFPTAFFTIGPCPLRPLVSSRQTAQVINSSYADDHYGYLGVGYSSRSQNSSATIVTGYVTGVDAPQHHVVWNQAFMAFASLPS